MREWIYKLVEEHGWPITYEEPLWRGLPQVAQRFPGSAGRLSLPTRLTRDTFDVSGAMAKSGSDPKALLEKSVQDYRSQANKGTFQCVEKKPYWMIRPDVSAGMISLLDKPLNVPILARTPEETVVAFVKALNEATHIPVNLDLVAADHFNEEYTGKRGLPQIMWGVTNMSARDALVDLLAASRTTFTWEFDCDPATQAESESCTLSLSLLRVKAVGPNGMPELRVIQFDRQPPDFPTAPPAPQE